MNDKRTTLDHAFADMRDGMTVMVGGFGTPGTPMTLVRQLLATGVRDLTLIKNDGNEAGRGISLLLEAGRVRKLVLSHMGLNAEALRMMNEGELEVEFHPQGILAEKIRCGGAGLPGFLTDIGIDTVLRETRQVMEFQGKEVFVEPSLRADLALIHAARGDAAGNLVYTKSARNFNPLMAMSGDLVIAECARVSEIGTIDPDHVHTPSAFVDRLVVLDELSSEYGVLEHHVLQA